VQEAISRNLSGTGFGLTISKNLVEMLGGEIRVDSIPGEGSTFYFTLPLRISSKNISRPKEEVNPESKPALDLTGKTILVVEDVDTNYFYMSSLLQKFNCKILRANNGAKAIDICKTDPSINLVLMDIELPVLDGYKATTEIKKIRPELPIIAQTAFAMMGEREKSKEAGCNDYLAKPIRKKSLFQLSGSTCNLSALVSDFIMHRLFITTGSLKIYGLLSVAGIRLWRQFSHSLCLN
jgi:CheY-like chemotaxis protein